MSLIDKLLESLGNIKSMPTVEYCNLCKKELKRTIEINIQECTNFDILLNVVLCENCFKESLEVIFGE